HPPSVNQGVHPSSASGGPFYFGINNAYRVLIRDDLLRSVPGRGYFIGGPVRYRDFFVGCVGDCSCGAR
ncbi:hypothetical protein, partial [Curtobacterium sp. VKM Ac-2887]|uniref:hypothetical protein n=1 Tax=Curtobacterium sp. VKM Ac-2887 TaxID=2783819 RepID=UPI001E4E6546